LTEWQLYAQKIEGESWVGEKLDPMKVQKMSGKPALPYPLFGFFGFVPRYGDEAVELIR